MHSAEPLPGVGVPYVWGLAKLVCHTSGVWWRSGANRRVRLDRPHVVEAAGRPEWSNDYCMSPPWRQCQEPARLPRCDADGSDAHRNSCSDLTATAPDGRGGHAARSCCSRCAGSWACVLTHDAPFQASANALVWLGSLTSLPIMWHVLVDGQSTSLRTRRRRRPLPTWRRAAARRVSQHWRGGAASIPASPTTVPARSMRCGRGESVHGLSCSPRAGAWTYLPAAGNASHLRRRAAQVGDVKSASEAPTV